MYAGDAEYRTVLSPGAGSCTCRYFEAVIHRFRVLGSCVIILAARSFAQDPFHRSYTIEDGLPSDQVYCAMQDRDGYMWFGTDAGVSRFDGVEFTNLGPADGLSDNEVIGIHEDLAGRIWFLTLNGVLSFWQNGSMHNASTDPILGRYRGGSGWATFCEDAQGRLWFGGIRGDLLRLDLLGDSSRYVRPDFMLRSVVRDGPGPVLCVSGMGVEQFKDDSLVQAFPLPDDWLTNHIAQPRSMRDHPIGLSASGVFTISAQGVALLPGTAGQVDVRLHRSAMRDEQGNIWLCRKDEGIDLLARAGGRYETIEHQFGTTRINTICLTGAAARWYCTSNQGVLLVDDQVRTGTAHYRSDRNSGSAFISIAAQGDRVWTGTDQGHILTFGNGKLEEAFRPDEGRLPGRILRIVPDDQGNVWFGTDWGLFKWSTSEPAELAMIPAFDTWNGRKRVIATPAKSVMVSSDGTIWSPGVGLWKQVIRAGHAERQRVIADDLVRPRIYCIAEDASRTIWLSDADLLISLRDQVTEVYELPDGYRNSRITDILHLGGDTLAIATAGNGVLLWTKDRQVGSINTADGLVSGMVRKLRSSGDTLWCATAQGISALELRRGEVVDCWTWSVQHGLPTNNVYDMLIRPDRVLMATALGLCIAPHRPAKVDRPPPHLVLAHLLINDSRTISTEPSLTIRTTDRLQLDVHALEFANAELVEYACSIDDAGAWSPCAQGHVVVQGLDEGEHRVRVRARFPGGDWSVPLSVPFSARPAWWASNLAKAAVAFGVVAILLLALYYWSRRGFRKKLERVRATVALNEERRRIAADVHDDLGADLSRVLMHARRLESMAPEGDGAGVSQGISATIDKIDEIIWSLDPRRDTLRSTVHFIEQQAREMAEAYGLSYRTLVELPEGDLPLAAAERREVMLIAREALRNVVEHARASTIRLEWRVDAGTLHMVVQDDGIGMIRPTGTTDRSGLHNMRQRAERLGGTLDFGPVEPHGTKVELRLRMKSNHPIG